MRLLMFLSVLAFGCGKSPLNKSLTEEERRFLLCAAKCVHVSEQEINRFGSSPAKGAWLAVGKQIDKEIDAMPALIDPQYLNIRKRLKELSIAIINVDTPLVIEFAHGAFNNFKNDPDTEKLAESLRFRIETCKKAIASLNDECNAIYSPFDDMKSSL